MPAPAVTLAVARIAFPELLLADLRLTLAAGEITCLLGPSGCGKTTLLRALAGLLPAGGAHSFTVTPDPAPPVSYMAQQDGLLPWASVLDNVLFAPRLRQRRVTPEQHARAVQIIANLGIGAMMAARPAALSGGQRQRVALARTLIAERPVVLMDEPFAALDFPTRWRLQALAAAHLRGRTVLLVTHDPLEALRLGHHLVVLEGQPLEGDPLERQTGTLPPRLVPFAAPPGEPPRDAAACAPFQAALVARIAGEGD